MGPDRSPQPHLPQGVGVLVVGHGTADAVGVAETRDVTQQVARMLPGVPVTLGFLEVCGPTISEAMDVLAAAGCRDVIAAPLLLFEAGHAKRDVPDAIREAACLHGIRVYQADPLGCHPDIVTLAARRRAEAMAAAGGISPEETTLVVVGRGSSDPTALCQLEMVTEATLSGSASFANIFFGFVAAARPTLTEAIRCASDPGAPGVRMVVVQPHLLFRGHVEEQVASAVDTGRASRPDLAWVRVPRLGADPLVAAASVARILERASEVSTKTVSPNSA